MTPTKQTEIKENVTKEFLRRRKLLKTKLCNRNIIKGMNNWIVSFVRYSAPFLDWAREELKNTVYRTRKLITV